MNYGDVTSPQKVFSCKGKKSPKSLHQTLLWWPFLSLISHHTGFQLTTWRTFCNLWPIPSPPNTPDTWIAWKIGVFFLKKLSFLQWFLHMFFSDVVSNIHDSHTYVGKWSKNWWANIIQMGGKEPPGRMFCSVIVGLFNLSPLDGWPKELDFVPGCPVGR